MKYAIGRPVVPLAVFTICAICAICAISIISVAPVRAQEPATVPASQPTTTAQATTAPAVDPAAMSILKRLETAGDAHKTIRANVTMELVDRLTGDSESRTGWIAYQKATEKTTTLVRVHFDTLKQGDGPILKNKLDHAFDGHFWTVAKHSIKDMVRYQVVAVGQKAKPMRLGEGPLPLPFGQKAQDVLRFYTATTRPPREGEPKGTVYLNLKVRREHYRKMNFTRVEMWLDPKTYLPVSIACRDKDKKTTRVHFTKLETNAAIDMKVFHMPRPAGWTYKVEPLHTDGPPKSPQR